MLTVSYFINHSFQIIFNQARAGLHLVSWNHFDADVGMCVYMCMCVCVCVSVCLPPQAIKN